MLNLVYYLCLAIAAVSVYLKFKSWRSPIFGRPIIFADYTQFVEGTRRVENDPFTRFQAKNIDLSTFAPKYRNVIIVDQTLDEAVVNDDRPCVRSATQSTANCVMSGKGPVSTLEYHSNLFSRAVLSAHTMTRKGENEDDGWTIILK